MNEENEKGILKKFYKLYLNGRKKFKAPNGYIDYFQARYFLSKALKQTEEEYKEELIASELLWKRLGKYQEEWVAENPKERELTRQDALKLIEWKIKQTEEVKRKRIIEIIEEEISSGISRESLIIRIKNNEK